MEYGKGDNYGDVLSESADLQGRRFDCAAPAVLRQAVELAFDYRGDITVELADGAALVGYLSNRDLDATDPFIEIYPATGDAPLRIGARRIAAIEFSGVDTAAGKSWEAWLARVAEAETQGEIAELYPESLDH